MYKIVKTQTRTSVDVPFYHEYAVSEQTYKDYFKKNYIDAKKLLSYNTIMSEDRLTATHTLIWESRQAFLNFNTDLYIYRNQAEPARNYDIDNNITSTFLIEEFHE